MIEGPARQVVARSVLAHLGNMGANPSIFSVVRKLQAPGAYGDRWSYQEYAGVVSQVLRAADAARRLERRPVNALSASDHPVDPSIPWYAPQYQYRVRVTVRNDQTGAVFDTVVDVRSDTVLTRDQARESALRTVRDQQHVPVSPPPPGWVMGTTAMTAVVVSAGQRA